MTVRTRFAPSPTGYLHIGGVRTALFSWLYARRHGGRFILRIEDTDRGRSTERAVQVILDGLEWLGIDWDEGPYFQTRRAERYRAAVKRLLDTGHAYYCYCTREELETMRQEQRARGEKPRYDGRCRNRREPRPGVSPVVRFRMPDSGRTVVQDLVCGRVVFENAQMDDLIIQRSNGMPTYNLSVVVDDLEMGITHVIRGDDHLNNTPKQLHIFNALESKAPFYSHVPMILGPDGTKLSKRHGAANVLEYRERGYLAEAVVNYLVRLGWSHGDQEIFSRREMIELFDISQVNRSAAAINPGKLDWLNQHYLKTDDPREVAAELAWQLGRLGMVVEDREKIVAVVRAQRERVKTLEQMARSGQFFFCAPPSYDAKAAQKFLLPAGEILELAETRLSALTQWRPEKIHRLVADLAAEKGVGLGKVAQPIRVAVSGGAVSPPIDQTLFILGREETLARLRRAHAWIGKPGGRVFSKP